MAIDFPNSPAINDTYTVGNRTWKYDGEKWLLETTLLNGVPSGGLEGQILAKETDANYDTQWIDNYTGDLRIVVKNDSGVTISKGQAVMAVGAIGDRIRVAKAVADGSVSAKYMLGVASQDISNGTEGYIQMLGEVRKLNTIAYSVGTVLYIDPNTPGNLTSTAPVAPDLAEAVAIVTRSHASTGILFVRMWSQGESVSDLHDVAISGLTSGDFLKYDGTKWVNDPINLGTDTVGSYVASLVAGTGVTITNNSGEGATPTIAIGQAVGTTSNVVFSSASLYGDTESYLHGGYLDIYTVSFSGGLPSSVLAGTIAAHPSGSGLLINGASGAPVYVDNLIGANTSEFLGPINVQAIREKVIDSTITSNVMTCNYTYGGIFYQGTAPSANFTVNVTNLPTDNGNAITVSVFVTQGSTGYYPSALQIGGASQTIKWAGGSAPTPTSSSGKIDVFTFTMIRRGSSWTVLGSANLNY